MWSLFQWNNAIISPFIFSILSSNNISYYLTRNCISYCMCFESLRITVIRSVTLLHVLCSSVDELFNGWPVFLPPSFLWLVSAYYCGPYYCAQCYYCESALILVSGVTTPFLSCLAISCDSDLQLREVCRCPGECYIF